MVIITLVCNCTSVSFTVAVLPSSCEYFCNSEDSIVLHTSDIFFSSVPETIRLHVDRPDYCWRPVTLTVSDSDWGAISIFHVYPLQLKHLATVCSDCIPSTVGHWSYCRIPLASDDCSFNLHLWKILVEEFAFVTRPRTSEIFSSQRFLSAHLWQLRIKCADLRVLASKSTFPRVTLPLTVKYRSRILCSLQIELDHYLQL